MPCPNLAVVGCYVSVIVLCRSVWNLYALPVLYCLALPNASSKFQLNTYLQKLQSCMLQLSKSHMQYSTIFTWFPTLQRGWVRSPGHVGTHCTHLCPWNQPWTAAVGYGGSFCCTLEVLNGPSAWRSGLSTASCNSNKISQMV